MKTMMGFFRCICLSIIVLFAACESGTLHEVYRYPKELWGEWIRMDTGKTWYIASNYITTSDNKDNITIQKQSENVIRATKTTSGNTSVFYLYASRIPNGSFSGSVSGLDDVRSAINSRAAVGGSGLGGINVTISNRNDKANEVKATTDADGNFEADGVIPGDVYEITGDGFSIPVYPNNSGEDIGTVTVTDGVNLITSIKPQSIYGDVDMMRLYTEIGYDLKIVVENVGNVASRPVQYTLTLPDGLEILENTTSNKLTDTTGILGTIESGTTREILIKVKCGEITDEYEYKNIGIETEDDMKEKTWKDSVSLKFNRKYVTFNVVSAGAISGVVIVPNVKTYYFLTQRTYDDTAEKYFYTSNIRVPRYTDDYLIVFSGATAASESLFSFAVDRNAEKDFNKNFHFGEYRDNTTEAGAANVSPDDDITYYLEKNNIIYFKVSF